MKIGLALPHYDCSFPDGAAPTVERVVRYAARAEALGFDSVWISDHLYLDLQRYGGPAGRQESPEAVTLMGAVVAATDRVRVGSLVLGAPFRNPVFLAQAARTLADAGAGRIELGLGAGWHEAEFDEAGIAFGSAGERITYLSSYAATVREHLPDGPPIWIGGKGGPRIMRIVAEHADGWNVVWQMTTETYAERLATLEAACERAGRDPATVRRSVGLYTLLGRDSSDLAVRYERLGEWAPPGTLTGTLDEYAPGRLVGTPDECASIVAAFAEMGVEEMILAPAHLPFAVCDDEQLDLIGSELLPLVR